MKGKPLTLEKYHRFFLDPWGTRITIDQLNEVLTVKSPSHPVRSSSSNFSSLFRVPPACVLIFGVPAFPLRRALIGSSSPQF